LADGQDMCSYTDTVSTTHVWVSVLKDLVGLEYLNPRMLLL